MNEHLQVLLDAHVRPQLQGHGGDAEILSYENGILRLRLLGQCASCPAAALTNETLIEGVLKEHLPELKEVILAQGVSQSLLDEAKRLMTRGGDS